MGNLKNKKIKLIRNKWLFVFFTAFALVACGKSKKDLCKDEWVLSDEEAIGFKNASQKSTFGDSLTVLRFNEDGTFYYKDRGGLKTSHNTWEMAGDKLYLFFSRERQRKMLDFDLDGLDEGVMYLTKKQFADTSFIKTYVFYHSNRTFF